MRIFLVFLAAMLLSGCRSGGPSASAGPTNNSAERKAQILANILREYPQLEDLNPTLGEITRHPSAQVDQTTMTFQTPQGPQTQTILLSPDEKVAFLLMGDPVDVSMSQKEITAANEKKAQETTKALTSLIDGYPFRGKKDAPVTVIEFSDFQCPYCKRGFETMEKVMEAYPEKVKFVFMHYPLGFHPWAKPASIAALCAGKQNSDAFWKLHDGYFHDQEAFNPENVIDKSKTLLADAKLDLKQWETCAADANSDVHKSASKTVDDIMKAGSEFGVEGTPAFFINGNFVKGAVPFEALKEEIDNALKTKG